MPYIVRPKRLPSGVIAACSALLMFGAASAQAETSSTTSSACKSPELTQPFLSAHDSHYYMLAPGQKAGAFEGQGWTLSGGAKILKTTLPGGGTGSVLDLSSGSRAVSPVMCVNTEYPVARTMVRDVVGAEGVFFSVSYEGQNNWLNPQDTGQVHGSGSTWTLSSPVNMQPFNEPGWQHVKVTLSAGGNTSDFQVDDLYIDPYKR